MDRQRVVADLGLGRNLPPLGVGTRRCDVIECRSQPRPQARGIVLRHRDLSSEDAQRLSGSWNDEDTMSSWSGSGASRTRTPRRPRRARDRRPATSAAGAPRLLFRRLLAPTEQRARQLADGGLVTGRGMSPRAPPTTPRSLRASGIGNRLGQRTVGSAYAWAATRSPARSPRAASISASPSVQPRPKPRTSACNRSMPEVVRGRAKPSPCLAQPRTGLLESGRERAQLLGTDPELHR